LSQPAARLTDMHVCPMVTGVVPHVGGPIVSPGAPTVLTCKLPQARMTDMCVCVGPPDMIISPCAPTVLVSNLPAARMGDMTVHGGVIVLGCFTVLIGNNGGSAGAGGGAVAPPMTPECAELAEAHDMGVLSAATYDPAAPVPEGYSRVTDPGELSNLGLSPEMLNPPAAEGSNFSASVFRRDDPPGYVIGYRGTQMTEMADWESNARQGVGLPSDHYDRAMDIARRASESGADVSYTGHSLGGGMASAAAVTTGSRATTFNSAGLSAATVGGYPDSPAPVTSYNTPRDPLSAVQDNRGGVMAGITGLAGLINPYLGAGVGGYLAGREMGDSPILPQAYGTRHELPETEGFLDRINPLNIVEPHSMDSVMEGIEAAQANAGC
jgi:uncharacterized Zn-binding protein involved in type VI secretion